METQAVFSVSDAASRDVAESVLRAAERLFFRVGFDRTSMDEIAQELRISKKTIYRHFPGKRELLAAVLDRQFGRVEAALRQATAGADGKPFEVQVEDFLIAAAGELSRIGAPQLLWGRGDPVLRSYVEQRVEEVVYVRIDELFANGHRLGAVRTPPELLSLITRGAVESLLSSQLPYTLEATAADLLRETVHVVLHGALSKTAKTSRRQR